MGNAIGSPPDVSVVIPCYNTERWVGRAIDSVLAQEGVSVEVIAIDDGSTDGSLEILRSYGNRIIVEAGPNRGACAARNRGLELARADYVMFLDADDFISPEFLHNLYQALIRNDAHCAIGTVIDASEVGTSRPREHPRTDCWRSLLVDWLLGKFVPPCGMLWRSSHIRSIGGWNTSLRKNQDGEMVYRAMLSCPTIASTTTGYAVYWHHSGERISRSPTQAKLLDSLSSIQYLTDRLSSMNEIDSSLRRALSLSSHQLERHAIKYGLTTVVEQVRIFRKSQRFPRYDGTTLHVAACYLVGLNRKENLSNFLEKRPILKKLR